MKRLICLLMILCLLAAVTACGSSKSSSKAVPGRMLDWVIEDFVKENKDFAGTCIDSESEVSHDWDKETKTDTVTINLTLVYPHLTASASCELTYQYDRSKDAWELIRGGDWTPLHVDRHEISTSSEEWLDAINRAGFSAYISGEGPEWAEDFISDASWSNLHMSGQARNGWGISQFSNDMVMEAYFVEADSREAARTLFEALYERLNKESNEVISTIDSTDSTEGSYRRLTVSIGEATFYAVLICENTSVYLADTACKDLDENSLMDMTDAFLREVGFVPQKR